MVTHDGPTDVRMGISPKAELSQNSLVLFDKSNLKTKVPLYVT